MYKRFIGITQKNLNNFYKNKKMDKDKVQKLKFIIAIFIIVLVIAFVAFRIIKYQTEGEKNMPFNYLK